MATSFFCSWALWAKMSFVLAVATVAVFGIGYAKLAWSNRLVKKQESRDEEERVKVQSLRQSGQMIEPRKSQDIPFGVRAIQSGIQVDGIWQSMNSTPVSASPKFFHLRNSSSDRSGSQTPSPRASLDISQAPLSASSRGISSINPNELGGLPVSQSGAEVSEIQETRGYRPSYKPRRSSHLRYGSHGEANNDEDTLDQMEGKAVPNQEHSQRSGGVQEVEILGDALSGAIDDNERSFGSETDVALHFNFQVKASSQHKSLPVQHPHENFLSAPTISTRSVRASFPSYSSKPEYSSFPFEPLEPENSDSLVLPLSNPMETPLPMFRLPYLQTAGELAASGESKVPLLSLSRSPSLFIPGELHMNKAARKVNSGFEVLPAGTFGIPVDLKGKRVDRGDRWNLDDHASEEKQLNKLQKKIQTSTSSRRPSSTFESP